MTAKSIPIDLLKTSPETAIALAKQPGGVEVVGSDGHAFRLSIPWADIDPLSCLILRIRNTSGHPLRYATSGSIGLDLHAVIGTPRQIGPGQRWKVDTGIAIELPNGLGALVMPRSGLPLHHGIVTVPGTIDRDYRGTIGATLINESTEPYTVYPGERIAQLVLIRVPTVEIWEVDELSPTDRGTSGFGSTGR